MNARCLVQSLHLPLPAKPRQTPLAGEQFLHGALFDLALLGDELLQGFDEGIRIAQRLGDGLLFGFGRREGDCCVPDGTQPQVSNGGPGQPV